MEKDEIAFVFYQLKENKMYQTILYTQKNHIAIVTINRPEYGNAFSEETYEEIIDVMHKINENEQIDVAILTGAGKYFCSGGDIRFFQKMIDNEENISEENVLLTGQMVKSIKKNSKPVIAAINGVAAGAGLGLAMACDFILMGENSQLIPAFINMAFPGDTALIYTLQQAIGTFQTKKHVMLNEPITATLAQEYGIAYDVVLDEDLEEAANQLATKLVQAPTEAIGYQKALMAEMFYPEIEAFNQKEAEYMHKSSKSKEHKEAVAAFLSKRKPDFKK